MKHVIIIDHDEQAANSVIKKLSSMRTDSCDSFKDLYIFHQEIVKDLDRNKFPRFAAGVSAKYRSMWPSAILVDFVMPHEPVEGLGGLDLVEALKCEFPRVPIGIYTQVAFERKNIFLASRRIADILVDLSNPGYLTEELEQFFVSFRQACKI